LDDSGNCGISQERGSEDPLFISHRKDVELAHLATNQTNHVDVTTVNHQIRVNSAPKLKWNPRGSGKLGRSPNRFFIALRGNEEPLARSFQQKLIASITGKPMPQSRPAAHILCTDIQASGIEPVLQLPSDSHACSDSSPDREFDHRQFL
jgi:hypothetical protein